MNMDEFKLAMEKAKSGEIKPSEEVVDSTDVREKAMKEYLDDVTPISQFINKGFENIEAKKLTKKEGSSSGR